MLLPVEPFQGNARVVGVQAPPLKQFVDNRVSLHVVLTEIPVASRGDVNVGKGIEASQRFKYRLEGETPLLEEFDVRLALFSQLLSTLATRCRVCHASKSRRADTDMTSGMK